MCDIPDLRDKRVCFPSYEGFAHLAVKEAIFRMSGLSDKCVDVTRFFASDSCNWHKGRQCRKNCLDGDFDVSFVDYNTFKNHSGKIIYLP
jgi:hypothetical protein